jgi:hypothetical protein
VLVVLEAELPVERFGHAPTSANNPCANASARSCCSIVCSMVGPMCPASNHATSIDFPAARAASS